MPEIFKRASVRYVQALRLDPSGLQSVVLCFWRAEHNGSVTEWHNFCVEASALTFTNNSKNKPRYLMAHRQGYVNVC